MANVSPPGSGVSSDGVSLFPLTVGVSLVTGGTNGYLLYDNNGVVGAIAPSALSLDLDVGSTTITGGTTGRLLYDNAGVLGETAGWTTNGTALTGAAGTTLAIGGATIGSNALAVTGTTQMDGLRINSAGGGNYISSVAANPLVFRSAGGSNIYFANSAGTTRMAMDAENSGIELASLVNLAWSADNTAFGTRDLFLRRSAAANLALGAADAASPVAQTLSVQNVVAGTSNTAGVNFTIAGSRGTGTGAGGNIVFQIAPAGSSGSSQNALVSTWQIVTNGTGGHLWAATDNLFDIGQGGANRPRNVYAAAGFISGSSDGFWISTRGRLKASADGVFNLTNNAETDFSRLAFGGTTSSFPSLKRSGTDFHARLADDSAFTSVVALSLFAAGGTIGWSSSTKFTNLSDGVTLLNNNAGTDYTRLILGTNDASGVAIKKNATAINFRLGNDSADAAITAASITTTGGGAFTVTQANSVSPTSPNRTITISLAGTTYYLAAKTTND